MNKTTNNQPQIRRIYTWITPCKRSAARGLQRSAAQGLQLSALLVLQLLFTLATLSLNAQTSTTTDQGVTINGIKWATRNVDAFGTFAPTPESPGMFYQWNRPQAWTATDPTVTGWNNTDDTGSIWNQTNDPSPTGWRAPTRAEIESLLDPEKVESQYTKQNGINGRKFTDKTTGDTLFLPAAGYREYSRGSLNYPGIEGRYWSSTHNPDNTYYVYNLEFDDYGNNHWNNCNRRYAQSIRSVSSSTTSNTVETQTTGTKTPVAYYTLTGQKLKQEPPNGIYVIIYDNGTTEKKINN